MTIIDSSEEKEIRIQQTEYNIKCFSSTAILCVQVDVDLLLVLQDCSCTDHQQQKFIQRHTRKLLQEYPNLRPHGLFCSSN